MIRIPSADSRSKHFVVVGVVKEVPEISCALRAPKISFGLIT